jgi:site-specific DNA recombinase
MRWREQREHTAFQLLVERVDVSLDGLDVRLRTEGLTNLVTDLRAINPESRRAA